MGADQFDVTSVGMSADAAFHNAVRRAQYEHGHSGYTGTIAEKDSFKMFKLEDIKDLDDDELFSLVEDKWGPAGCIDLGNGRYRFFGWASS